MLRVIDTIEEKFLGTVSDGKIMTEFDVYADIGKNTKEFYGLTIKNHSVTVRRISFHDLSSMKEILETMGV